MNDTDLNLGFRVDGIDCLWEAGQVVNCSDNNILHLSVLKLCENSQPKWRNCKEEITKESVKLSD